MAFLDLAKVRVPRSIVFLLLLSFSFNALASDSQTSNFTAQDFRERKLAALSPGPTASAPSPSTPLPPPPSNERPALITPSANSPQGDLPPEDLNPPLPSDSHSAPITSPASPSSKQSNVAVILGVTLGVVVFLLVSVSATAYFRPEWLPCCRGRSSQITQYERHLPS